MCEHRKKNLHKPADQGRSRRTYKKRRIYRRRALFGMCYAVFMLGFCIFLYLKVDVSQNIADDLHWLSELAGMDMGQQETTVQDGWENLAPDDLKLDKLHSSYAILLDAQTGQVLAEKNGDARMCPASMTKLMAALVAVENTKNWDETLEIPQEIFAGLYLEHASLAGFEPGERVKPEELLYGMLLPSGAECCTTYALWLAGGEENFVAWMNEKAQSLGMESTHFENTTGLHDEEHYSSVHDMAVLLRACLENDILRRILSAESFQTAATSRHPQGLGMESTLFQTIEQNRDLSRQKAKGERAGVTLLGGKTGYTSQAGLCLASFALVNGREYILVTAGAEGNHYTEPFHVQDALEVYTQVAEATKKWDDQSSGNHNSSGNWRMPRGC